MKARFVPLAISVTVGVTCAFVFASSALAVTRQIPSSGTTQLQSAPLGVDGLQFPELRPSNLEEEQGGDVVNPQPGDKEGKGKGHGHGKGNGIFPQEPLPPPEVESSDVASPGSELDFSIEGLNHRQQRLANGGNQFSLEPPDQALCVGNGYALEGTNSVLRIFSSADGTPLTGVQDINTFFGYPAAVNRTTGAIGPNVIDPVCLYDPEHERFVVAITTLFVDAAGHFNGKNTIDVAVSNSGDPTGAWTIYHVPAQNDGTDGTPDHGCTVDGTAPGPCFQDYPHIGQDANGVYITTNEYDLFGPSYNAAQLFAFSKAELAAHPASIGVTLVENLELEGTPGFTVWPAISNAGDYATDNGGTEFLLSTIAGDGSETGNPTRTANRIGLWALSNTSTLDSFTPALEIASRTLKSQDYVFPPRSDQKPGSIPLGDCINDTTIATPFGPGCWQLFFVKEPAHDEVESTPDSNDTRMQQVWYADGTLWGANDTAVEVEDEVKAGIAWFAVEPKLKKHGKLDGKVREQGYLALEGNNLSYPAIAMGPEGDGVIAFTVMGEDYYPSAAYAQIDDDGHVGPVQIVANGLGPTDGFTSYKAFVGDPPRTRWGDYGAATTDGESLWIASEWIAQTCTLQQYLTGAIGSCGGTRTSLGNWSTRVTKLTP